MLNTNLWNYCPESDIHIRDKVKTVLDLSNYASKKNKAVLQSLTHLI